MVWCSLFVGTVFYVGCSAARPPILEGQNTQDISEEQVVTIPPDVTEDVLEEKQPEGAPETLPGGSQAYAEFLMAQYHEQKGDDQAALQTLLQALAHDPDSAVLKTEIASIYFSLAQPAKAEELCREALETNPDYLPANYLMARLHIANDDMDNAIVRYEHILALETEKQRIYLYLAKLYVQQEQYEEAIKFSTNCSRKTPIPPWACITLGVSTQKPGLMMRRYPITAKR